VFKSEVLQAVDDDQTSNPTDNESLEEVMTRRLKRRDVLKAAGAAGSLLVLHQALPGGVTGAASEIAEKVTGGVKTAAAAPTPLNFASIAHNLEDKVTVPAGYQAQVLLRWGDAIMPDAQGLSLDNPVQTPQQQEQRFGYNCDFIAYMPMPDYPSKNSNRGLLWVNHEYTNEILMFSPYSASTPDKAQVDVALAAHGGSIVEIVKGGSGWSYDETSTYNRRITGETAMDITGPAAGHDWLKTTADTTGTKVRGMLNNCGGGKTPWGTVLSAEENFNQYFGNVGGLASTDPKRTVHTRYGLGTGSSERGWEKIYSRFDVAKEPNEPFRFGWIVEIDPYNPSSTPKKRTALGRVKHEAANGALARDGRYVVYTGDDERFDYMYKFVTEGTYNPANRSANMNLLDKGTLYVAKFNDDGSGTWIPLVHNRGQLTTANGWSSQGAVLINTRGAADAVGATKMDRPEDIEVNPVTGRVYLALTNNTNRTAAQVDRANPRANNRDGHIIEFTEAGGDPGALSFTWNIFMSCGVPGTNDGSRFAGFPMDSVPQISSPDNIAFDNAGNLWIATDGQPGTIRMNDAIFAVPVQGEDRGHLRLFMTGVFGCEVAALEFNPDNSTLFVSIQHPGEPNTGPNSAGSTMKNPTSKWPDGGVPRPSVVAITKTNPGSSPAIGT
jgi:uncharacterized protein